MARQKPRIDILNQAATRLHLEYLKTDHPAFRWVREVSSPALCTMLVQMGIRAWGAGVRRERARARAARRKAGRG
jgi:hypothetical protein